MSTYNCKSIYFRCVAIGWVSILVVSLAAGAPRDLKIERSEISGAVTFVRGADGQGIPLRLPPGRTVAEPADFFREHGGLFGILDVEKQLRQKEAPTADTLGFAHWTFEQMHKGIPVFGGVLKVHRNAQGQIAVVNGRFFPITEKTSIEPLISREEAERLARVQAVSAAPEVERAELVLVDPDWYGDPPRGPRLAFHIVLADSSIPYREAFFIDARTRSTLDRWSLLHQGRFRLVYDVSGEFSQLVRREGEGPTGILDADRAYDFSGDLYGYLSRAFGRDSVDGLGMPLVSLVNAVDEFTCPNAFWQGEFAFFCEGVAVDDIIAHEFGHGVTEFSANLLYQNQSGQLNESFSDVLGELVDLFNGNVSSPGDPSDPTWPNVGTSGTGLDLPNERRTSCSHGPDYVDGVRWLVGEDSTVFGGAIRDMWNPTCFGDPDRANSPLQRCNVFDSGGVHGGSGVPNHAFAMLSDGKTFNGFTVNGIGLIKSGAVWFRALTTYLTMTSNFSDAYSALNQSAADLVGTVLADPRTGRQSSSEFSGENALEVDKALRAVEMDTPGRCGRGSELSDAPAPGCPGPRRDIFEDHFEGGVNGWTVSLSGPFGPRTPYNWELTALSSTPTESNIVWFCADPNIGDCFFRDESAVHSLVSPPIRLPPAVRFPILSFRHSFLTEAGFDGGNVKLSVDGGPWQLLPNRAFSFNDYTAAALFGPELGSTNPLGGEPAFSGGSETWGTSRISLGSFVRGGESIRLRFDFGKDGCGGRTGWFIDDVEVFDCVSVDDCNENAIPDQSELAQSRLEYIAKYPHYLSGSVDSDVQSSVGFPISIAQPFSMEKPGTVKTIRIWGQFTDPDLALNSVFSVLLHRNVGGIPRQRVSMETGLRPAGLQRTGELDLGLPVFEITFALPSPVPLEAGSYFVEIFEEKPGTGRVFLWETSEFTGTIGCILAFETPGEDWVIPQPFHMSLEIPGGLVGGDCNQNRIPDDCDVNSHASNDENGDLVPDECTCGGDIGDQDDDRDIDLFDIAVLFRCFGGSAWPNCLCSNAVFDGNIDALDAGPIINQFTGPTEPVDSD